MPTDRKRAEQPEDASGGRGKKREKRVRNQPRQSTGGRGKQREG